jgi:GT2 family glycosyltransferase
MTLTNPQPLITVILPVYNVAPTLAETIESLFAQTEPNWEAVIVNDGSTDETPRLIEDFLARDSRLRAITLPNGGVSKAMNRGIAEARADRVMFLDGDDWLAPHYIARMLRALAENPSADIPYCGFYRVPPEGWQLPVEFVPELAKRPFEELSTRCAFASHCVVLPRKLLEEHGGFDTSLITSEDWDLWLRIARGGARFVGVPEGLAYYRARPGSATSNYLRMIADLREVMARVQAPDPRVKTPHPRYANGVKIAEPELRVLSSALLLAGVECVNGRPGAPALDPLEPLPDCSTIVEENCNALAHGLMFTRPGFSVADVWDALEPHLRAVCARLQNASVGHIGAEAMVRRVAGLVLAQCDLAAPRRLVALYACAVDLDRALPTLIMPDGTDHLFLRLIHRGKVLEDVCVAAQGRLSPAALLDLIRGSQGLARGSWLCLPANFVAKTARAIHAVMISRRNRKARLLGLLRRLGDHFAAAVHLVAREA